LTRSRLSYAKHLAGDLAASRASDKIIILNRIVSRITLKRHSISIALRTHELYSEEHTDDSSTLLIEVPVLLKRCGMAVKLIVQPPGAPTAREPDPKMVALVAKAHQWFAKLVSGKYDSIQAIAQEQNVSRSYCTRVIYLSFLDPTIIQSLLAGEQPIELNAERLNRIVPLPSDWKEQRLLLGMAGQE